MVRILALLLSLLSTPAHAQATFTTVISPTTLGTSPLGVTFGASPHSVICISGCAGGASPSSVIVTNQPTVTASLSGSPFVYQGTAAWQVNIIGGSTIPVSVNGPMFVSQGTSPWTVTSSTSPIGVVATSAFVSNLGPAITFADSLTTASGPTAVAAFPFLWNGTNWDRTVGTSKLGAYVNITNNGSTFTVTPSPSPLAVVQTSGFTNVTSPLAVTLPVSPITVGTVTSAAVTNISAAGTSPLAVTLSSSPTAIAEQNGLAYPNRANWKQGSVTTTGTASAVVIGAPAANKLYITSLQCWRSDAGTSPMTMRFNDPAAQFTVAVGSNMVNMVLNPALVMSATTSLQFSASTSLTSVGCNAQGYNNP